MGAPRVEGLLGPSGLAPRYYDPVQRYRRQTRSHQILVALLRSHLVVFPSGQITFFFAPELYRTTVLLYLFV